MPRILYHGLGKRVSQEGTGKGRWDAQGTCPSKALLGFNELKAYVGELQDAKADTRRNCKH